MDKQAFLEIYIGYSRQIIGRDQYVSIRFSETGNTYDIWAPKPRIYPIVIACAKPGLMLSEACLFAQAVAVSISATYIDHPDFCKVLANTLHN